MRACLPAGGADREVEAPPAARARRVAETFPFGV